MDDVHVLMRGLREVCHDIRQPLAGILALAGAALADPDLPGDARSRLEGILDLAQCQSDMLEHWLQASVNSDDQAGGSADVVLTVSEAAAAERLTWTGNLTLVWPPEPATTPVHPVMLRRMTANLLSNATRAAGPGGCVTLEVSCPGDQILVAVEDDGPGFGRLAGHHGLGLSAVARAAIQHGGKLECSRGSSGGGRVLLWLPSAPSRAKGQLTDAPCPL